MAKEQFIKIVEGLNINIDNLITNVEKEMKDNNIDYKNIITAFVYNKVDYMEISLLTTPNTNIKIKCNIIK